jgi:glycosyltransferase involved in cell wall biosynthesis
MLKQKSEDSSNTVPLVSITVITYNSSKFVLETLQSAKQQTYRNIELIISDDCSTDETVEICRQWVEENKDRFVRTKIITSDYNTGIPANSNRAVRASKGEWIKGIAGDDILLPDCISQNVEYVTSVNSEALIVFSLLRLFHTENGKYTIADAGCSLNELMHFSGLPSGKQFECLLKSNILSAPTAFISKQLLSRYPYNEL